MGARLTGVRGLAGAIVDVVDMARLRFVNAHSLTKFRLIQYVRRNTGARAFVEVGTYKGATTKRAAKEFAKVYTIELDQALADRARAMFERYPNVEVIEGDALEELPKLLARAEVENVIVFLDGHFSGGITACGEMPEPACLEVESLGHYRKKVQGFVIDDFRAFGTENGFPTKSELLRTIERYFPESEFTYQLLFDAVVVIPKVIATQE